MEAPTDNLGTLYRFVAHYQQKEFVGQKAISQDIEEDVGGESVSEVLDVIWAKVKPWIKREVLIEADKIYFAKNESPDRDEIATFIIFQDKVAKKNYAVSQLTSDLLRKMREKHVNVITYVYGKAVASKTIHSKVSAAILQPVDRDRAGAHSTIMLMELTQKLKEVHGQHLSGNTSSWTMWSNSIHSAPAHRQEAMVNEMPPPHLIHLFRSVPISAQRGLQIAGNLNDMYTEKVQTLRQEFQRIKETMLRVFDMYDVRLKATEDMLVANSRLVGSRDGALKVEEAAVKLEEELQITDLIDTDYN